MSPTKPTCSTRAAKKHMASKYAAHKLTKPTPQEKQQQDEKHRGSQKRLRSKLDNLYEDILTQVETHEDVNAKQKTAILSLLAETIDHHMAERRRLIAELTALGVPIEEHLLKNHANRPQPQQAARVTQALPSVSPPDAYQAPPSISPPNFCRGPSPDVYQGLSPTVYQDPHSISPPDVYQGPPSMSPPDDYEGLVADFPGPFSLDFLTMFNEAFEMAFEPYQQV